MIESLSFCIISYGQQEEAIKRCLNSIHGQGSPTYEILIGGQCFNADESVCLPGEQWVREGALNKIRNLLCSHASHEYVALVDGSVELAADWYRNVRSGDCFDVLASRLTTPQGERAVDWAYPFRLGDRTLPLPLEYDEWTAEAYVSGFLMLLRRKVWERVRFDENLRPGNGDDLDFCIRATSLGFRTGAFPEASAVYHADGAVVDLNEYISFAKPMEVAREYRQAHSEGLTAYTRQDYAQALRWLGRVIDINPESPSVWAKIAWSHYFRGTYDKAIAAFDKALRVDGRNHEILRGRGWAFAQRGEHEKAVWDLSAALEYIDADKDRTEWHEASRGLAWSYYHTGRYQEAAQWFETILGRARPEEKGLLQDVYLGLGWSLNRMGEFEQASTCFERALESIESDRNDLLRDALRGLDTSRRRKTMNPETTSRVSVFPEASRERSRRGLLLRIFALAKQGAVRILTRK